MSITELERLLSGDTCGDLPEEVKIPAKPCAACTTELSIDEMMKIPCGHSYCHDCLEKRFTMALTDPAMFPPRCCGGRISFKRARETFSTQLAEQWHAKAPELNTQNRTYCHVPTCSTFILPKTIREDRAVCRQCQAVTCGKCREAWHTGSCSAGSNADFYNLVRAEHWRRCPGCWHLIERTDGCDHMTCRCNCEFCYECGKQIDDCKCEGGEDEEEDGNPGFMLFD